MCEVQRFFPALLTRSFPLEMHTPLTQSTTRAVQTCLPMGLSQERLSFEGWPAVLGSRSCFHVAFDLSTVCLYVHISPYYVLARRQSFEKSRVSPQTRPPNPMRTSEMRSSQCAQPAPFACLKDVRIYPRIPPTLLLIINQPKTFRLFWQHELF